MFLLKKENLDKAVELLKKGKILIFPTETSYGLGCDATNQKAVDKIFKIKGRQTDKPLLVVAPTVESARKYLEWSDILEKISSKRWPGPITVVGKYKINNSKIEKLKLSDGVVAKDGTVAVRVSAHPVCKFLSEKLGSPLVATSANLSEAGDIYDSADAIKIFENREFKPDAILDYGRVPFRKPTTIVSVIKKKLKILRQGEINVLHNP
ncbi:MAG: L-threonylcarbamoyladenylate synthase [Patescibacteria group bacterium]|nr:L-threonylcarbamoyladenylate synthase [Patescibacteria group bacterium]